MRMFVALIEIGRPVLIISTTEVYSKICSPKLLMYICKMIQQKAVENPKIEYFVTKLNLSKELHLDSSLYYWLAEWCCLALTEICPFLHAGGKRCHLEASNFTPKTALTYKKSYHPWTYYYFFTLRGGMLQCSRWSSMDRAQCPTDARSWEVETLQF